MTEKTFNYVTAEKAPLYRAIMHAFAVAKGHFVVHLRPEDVATTLEVDSPCDSDALQAALTQLAEWGNLLAQSTGRSLLYYAIPLLAGLAVTHSFVPPTPGPIAVADLLDADLGWVIIFGALAGIPSMILAGPMFGRYIARRIHVEVPDSFTKAVGSHSGSSISFAQVSTIILLPLVLIMLSTITPIWLGDEHVATTIITFLGHPFVALLAATLLAMALLARIDGFSKDDILATAPCASGIHDRSPHADCPGLRDGGHDHCGRAIVACNGRARAIGNDVSLTGNRNIFWCNNTFPCQRLRVAVTLTISMFI